MTVDGSSGTVGARLRQARESRGLSLRQIAGTTRISSGVLEALERNDISRLPGGIFARAFVRAYAREVGLDPEQIVAEFIRQFPTETVTAGHPAARPVEDREAADSAERAAWTIGRLVLASIPLAALVIYVSGGGGAEDADTAAAVPRDETPHVASVPVAMTPPPPADLPVALLEPTPGPLTLTLSASGPCWVSIEVDGRIVLRRELQAGDREVFEIGREFTIRAGNAGVLALALDGREVRSLGDSGEVVSFSASRDNFEDFLANP